MLDITSLFISVAHAQAAAPAAATVPAHAPYDTVQPQILMFILIFAVFYFFLIRPQQKKLDNHRAVLKTLKKGDKIVTGGGIHGVVVNLDGDDVVTVEIASGINVKIERSTIASVVDPKVATDTKKS